MRNIKMQSTWRAMSAVIVVHDKPNVARQHFIGLDRVTPPVRGGELPKLLCQREIYWISTQRRQKNLFMIFTMKIVTSEMHYTM